MLKQFQDIISRGSVEELQSLLNSGASVNEKLGKWNLNPLHLAAWYNQPRLIDFLTQKGANVNEKEKTSKKSPLHIASYFGHLEACQALLKGGANVGSEDKLFFTPLHYAALEGHTAVVRLFVKWGAHHRYSEEPAAQYNALELAIRHEHIETVDFLVEHVAVPFMVKPYDDHWNNNWGWTPILFATLLGSLPIVKIFIEKTPSLKFLQMAELQMHQTALHLAARDGHLEIVKLFCELPSWINVADSSGLTPLGYAIQNGHKKVEEWLLKKGAHLQEEKDVWWDRPSQFSPLHEAVWNGNLETVAQIIRGDEKAIFEKGKYGRNALQLAIRRRKHEIVQFLIEVGGFELIKQKNSKNDTAMHYAAGQGNMKAMEMLLDHNGSPLLYQKNEHGNTPIEKAAARHQFQMIDWLSKHWGTILNPECFWPGWAILNWSLIDHHPQAGGFFKDMETVFSSGVRQDHFSKSIA